MLEQIINALSDKELIELFDFKATTWESQKGKSFLEVAKLYIENNELLDLRQAFSQEIELLIAPTLSEYDSHGCILDIRVDQGGKDAQDFTMDLTKLYIQFLTRHKIEYNTLEYEPDVIGITHARIEIPSKFAYLCFGMEEGSHRQERKSPYNAKGKVQTSNCIVTVFPLITLKDNTKIEGEIEYKATRSGGPGGQNVNKTETAVIAKHVPTGIWVKCSEQRSQLQNRERAFLLLKAALIREQIKENEKKLASAHGKKNESIIRTYDYGLSYVKDNRFAYKTSRIEAVFKGYIEPFLIRSVLY